MSMQFILIVTKKIYLTNLQAAYISVMKNSTTRNRTGFESMLKLYREVSIMQERERILSKIFMLIF